MGKGKIMNIHFLLLMSIMYTQILFQFANILQIHYLRATRQNTAEPQRPLSLRELQYLAQLDQFKGKPTVHVRDFEAFWNWFGDAMHKIRHQKPFSSMWLQGYNSIFQFHHYYYLNDF